MTTLRQFRDLSDPIGTFERLFRAALESLRHLGANNPSTRGTIRTVLGASFDAIPTSAAGETYNLERGFDTPLDFFEERKWKNGVKFKAFSHL